MERFEKLAADHAAWSQQQFGSDAERDWTGPLAHMKKEIDEAEAEPFDREEWADLLLLLLDASRRAGFTANGLLLAAEYKLSINKNRVWGEPNLNGSVEHVRKPNAILDWEYSERLKQLVAECAGDVYQAKQDESATNVFWAFKNGESIGAFPSMGEAKECCERLAAL